MDILASFGENLSELIFDGDFNIESFSKAIGIDRSVIYRYLRNETLPSLDNLIKIADFFACSVDFLLGLSYDNNKVVYKKAPSFDKQFKQMLESKNLTRYKFCKQTNFAEQSVDDWYHGKRTPNVDNLIVIARYFGCSVDFILGRES